MLLADSDSFRWAQLVFSIKQNKNDFQSERS